MLSPAALLHELPLCDAMATAVELSRAEVRAVLDGADDRLLVVAGPCSVHDPVAAIDYAARLAALHDGHAADLLVVMRVYFEKPRTVTGWKGLINDPDMDGSHDVHRGLRLARRLLLDVVGLGLPAGCEWLDPITPQYLADAVTWGRSARAPPRARCTGRWCQECRCLWGSRTALAGMLRWQLTHAGPPPRGTRSSASLTRGRRRGDYGR